MIKKLKQYSKTTGFTLIELIVVLVILGIILAITVPAVTSYIDDAKDVTDDINISVLNKSTQAYNVYLYNELGKVPVDSFYDLTTDDARQQRLLDRNLLDEILVSTRGNTYTWDIPSQKWTINGESGGGTNPPDTKPRDDATILGDPDRGNPRGEWVSSNTYTYNDIVIKDGVTYKCTWSYGSVQRPNFDLNNYWKKIELNFYRENAYETGDIIMYNGEYYKATGFDSSNRYTAYKEASAGMFADSVIIDNLFTKVIWDGVAFINAT